MPAWSIKFEVAFDVNPATVPGAMDWTDLSDRLIDEAPITIRSGKNRLSGEAHGSASLVLDNSDRAIDPTNPSATYNLVPRRHAKLTATIGATTYDLFRGFVDAWPPTWSSYTSQVTVQLVDGFAWLALQDADINRSAELSSARLTALLDAAGWPSALRSIDTGRVQLEALEQEGANLYQSALDVAASEVGDLYCDPGGTITFKNRHARFDQDPIVFLGTESDSDTWNSGVWNDGIWNSGGIPFAAATPVWDTASLVNLARVELDDGTAYEASDATSMTAYGTAGVTMRAMSLRAAEAEAVAQWEVDRYADVNLWLDRVRVEDCEQVALESVLPLRIGDLVHIAHEPPSGGTIRAEKCVERWEHSIGAVTWTTHFDLSPYFGEGPWLTLDDATVGLLGANKLAP